jgi:hypothetical protein
LAASKSTRWFLLHTIRRGRWTGNASPEWLDKEDVIADPVTDLHTKDNALSVWLVDEERRRLPRLFAALAANRDSFSNLDYVLFDRGVLDAVGIRSVETPGKLLDPETRSWHLDLIELSGLSLVALVRALLESGPEIERVSERKIKSFLQEAMAEGHLPLSKVSARVRSLHEAAD